jgi:hypothetical protein
MTFLFDKMDLPNFTGLDADAAWDACEEWEDWMYSNADSFSEGGWDEAVCTARTNYDRYYKEYENDG